MPDHYRTLMVARDADTEVIEAAYRALAKKNHPDVNKGTDAHEKMIAIQAAKEVLCDPQKRAQYDLSCQEYDPFADDYVPSSTSTADPSPSAPPDANDQALSAAIFLDQGEEREAADLLSRCEVRVVPASYWTDETGYNSWHPDTFEVLGRRGDYEALSNDPIRGQVQRAFEAATGTERLDIVARFSPNPGEQAWHGKFRETRQDG